MNNKELTELKKEFYHRFEGANADIRFNTVITTVICDMLWNFFLPHLKSNDEIKRKAVEGFVEEYKKWLVFIPREYDRESIKNSLDVTADRYLTLQSLDKEIKETK